MSLYESIRAFQHLAKSWRFFKDPDAQDVEENLLIIYGSQRKRLFVSELSENDKYERLAQTHTQIKIRLKSNKSTIFAGFISLFLPSFYAYILSVDE